MRDDLSGGEGSLPDIDSFVQPTRDEAARLRAVNALHGHALLKLRFECRDAYERDAKKQFAAVHGRDPVDSRDVAAAMQDNHFFKFYSVIRYNAQEMLNLARQPAVERVLPQLIATARDAARLNPAGGTLRLDPDFVVPDYATEFDVHLSPGGFHTEFVKDDVAQGVVLGRGATNRSKEHVARTRNFGGVGKSIAHWLQQAYPDFAPRRVLDMGTQSGANLVAYPQAFPGIEAHGIDVAAPGLRYGHAKAGFEGVPVHFSQQDASATDFADGHFDLVVSSFFLHEVPVPVTRQILREAYRLLAPGGILAFMELPPHKACDPFLNFAYDWDTKNNNEPNYEAYRSEDPAELLTEAGFAAEGVFEITIPDVTSFAMDKYPAFLRGEVEAPPHGRGGWFIMGGRKPG